MAGSAHVPGSRPGNPRLRMPILPTPPAGLDPGQGDLLLRRRVSRHFVPLAGDKKGRGPSIRPTWVGWTRATAWEWVLVRRKKVPRIPGAWNGNETGFRNVAKPVI